MALSWSNAETATRSPIYISDSDEWESESEGDWSQSDEGIWIPPLLPVPVALARSNDNLCSSCANLHLDPRDFLVLSTDVGITGKGSEIITDLGTLQDLNEKSSRCPLCRLILRALGSVAETIVEDRRASVVILWGTDGPVPDIHLPDYHIPRVRKLLPQLRSSDGELVHSEGMNLVPEITLLANDSPTSYRTFFGRVIPNEIDFRVVKNWLSMCRTWHGSQCDKSTVLSYQDASSHSQIPYFRLIDVQDSCIAWAPAGEAYLTLSYVWGNIFAGDILSLRKDNVEVLGKRGALLCPENYKRIPQTIRDAIRVTRELNFRYLWVDSLCIIQNDKEIQEACISKMDLVYGGGYLTIIAATGEDAHAGLPGVRPGTRGTEQTIVEIGPSFRLAFSPKSQDYMRTSKYFRRGWTFQEQQFTKRSLLFIGGQVVYRCMRTEQWREDLVVEHRDSKYGTIARQDGANDDIRQYEKLIETYSTMSLTKESDIYHAFAGMIGYLKAELRANLCHGIPDAYFDWFLLWTSPAPQKRREGTPSWSWAGWHGESHFGIGQWYSDSITRIRRALRQRTWIVWYQRKAHNIEHCELVWAPKKHRSSTTPRNFYGSHLQQRFPFECDRTTPAARTLVGAAMYFDDTHNPSPGSGILQFWTVAMKFRLQDMVDSGTGGASEAAFSKAGLFGRDGERIGAILLNPAWHAANVPGTHEFILLCEGRDEREEHGRIDGEEGWKYRLMLIEWRGSWFERVALSSMAKEILDQGLEGGAVWKEIVLG
ncbi:hypothetical protein CVT26_015579 [Gymnopilus dilepis]|uniref:Heterokaryon incompatibility domain-containing protein n=1 Tax=Gymnopilus dilepis TaxID=231916 RepID=A0A409XYV2_9AGAR|nr:hypothetical protein CVT26_015579 [Gymnopilus dilepis]